MYDRPGSIEKVDGREARSLPGPMSEFKVGRTAVTLRSAAPEGDCDGIGE